MLRKKRFFIIIFTLVTFILLGGLCSGYENEPKALIPFEFYDNYIYIKVRINNSIPLDFAFDSGAEGVLINSSTADRLGFKSGEQVSLKGASGSVTAAIIRDKKVRIRQLELNGVDIHRVSLAKIEQGLGKNLDGIIGGIILRNFPLKIDFDRRVIKIYSFDNFNYQGRGEAIHFRLAGDSMPLVPVQLTFNRDEKITGIFGLDTGFGGTMMMNTPFVRKNKLPGRVNRFIELDYIGISGVKSDCYAGRVKKVQVGKSGIRQVPVVFNRGSSGAMAWNSTAGIIGNSLLKRFNIVFNYRKWELYFEANGFFYNDFQVNCSGLRISGGSSKTRVFVYDVIKNSPAAKAGIKKGDEIISINGRAVKNMSLPGIKEMLMKEGRAVTVTVKRSYGTRRFTLRLRKLI